MRIEMFGGLRALRGESVALRLRSRQAETLLCTLALSPGRSFSREELAERLWPDASPETARSRFKQELSALRRALALPPAGNSALLLTAPGVLRLDPALLTTDVADFKACLRSAESLPDPLHRIHALEQAVFYVRGPLLPGNYDPHLLLERERLTQACGEAFHQLARLYGAEGEMGRALQAARSAVQIDPLQEETHYDLIRLTLLSGIPGEALAQADDYTALVSRELREAPSARLLALSQHAQRFASTHEAAAHALRSLSPLLHKLLNTISHGATSGTLAAEIEAANPALLENIAQLHELGLLQSEPIGSTMTYCLLPVLTELLETPL